MNTMNVIIADDHPIVLFGIRKSLEQIEWVNVVGEFEDSTALINNLPKLDAHVLITDLSMPGDKYGDGITLIKYIKRHFPDLSSSSRGRRPTCQKRWPRCRKGRNSPRKASLACWKKSAPAAMAINDCRRKRAKYCACSPKVSW